MIRTDGLVARIRDHGLALSLGILIGIVGHIVWQRVDSISLGKDPLAYVDIVDEIHPIGASREAMLQRLDRLTDRSWELDTLFSGIKRGDDSLPANVERLSKGMNAPPSDSYRVQSILTNVLQPAAAKQDGRLAIIQFGGIDQARTWLRQDTQIFVDPAADESRDTYWAGELVVYYSPPESGTDHSASVRQWTEQVSDCPGTAGECGVSSTED